MHFVGVGNEREAVGFAMIARDFGQEFVGGDADGGGQLALGANAIFEALREREGLPQGGIESRSSDCYLNLRRSLGLERASL